MKHSNTSLPEDQSNQSVHYRRNFAAGLWHGAFLALGMSLTQPTTVLSAFIAELTGSTIWVGGLATVLTAAGALPQLFAARWIEPRPKKMPFLLTAIYLRVFSWTVLAWLIYTIGAEKPETLAWILVGMLVIFYAGGGLGNVPYTDIIGKIIPPQRRGAFFGGKGALAGPLSIGAALLARRILAEMPYPNNYALLFGLAAAGLAVASAGFLMIKEPVSSIEKRPVPTWHTFGTRLKKASHRLRLLILVQLLTGFSLMALPFYVVYASDILNAPSDATGWFLLAQVLGNVVSNLVWAKLVDHAGSRWMLLACATLSTATPLLAIFLGAAGWKAMLPVFFLTGASFSGRIVGFQSALLELAPEEERGSYAGLNEILILPAAFLPIAAGLILQVWPYKALFVLSSAVVGTGAVVLLRWVTQTPHLTETS